MNLKLGYFIPPLILLAFAVCIFLFGGTMYKNYQIEKIMKHPDRKYICLANTYDVKRDSDKRYYVSFKDGKKFYFYDFKALSNASYLLLVVDQYNRVTWTTVTESKARYTANVYSVPLPGCR